MIDPTLKPSKERLEGRKKIAAQREIDMLRPYIIADEYRFKATKEDADALNEMEGEVIEDTAAEGYGPKVETVYLKNEDSKPRLPYRKYCIPADDFNEFWSGIGARLSVKKLFAKKPAPKTTKKK